MECLFFVIPLIGLFIGGLLFGTWYGFRAIIKGNQHILRFLKMSFFTSIIIILLFWILSVFLGCGEVDVKSLLQLRASFVILFFIIFVGLYLGAAAKSIFRK